MGVRCSSWLQFSKHIISVEMIFQHDHSLTVASSENSNSVPAAFWSVVHIIQDTSLLTRVRQEVTACLDVSVSRALKFNIDALCHNPLLQSIWYETLRLYVALFIVRGSDHDDFFLDNGHCVSKGQMIVLDTYTAHHDTAIWSTGTAEISHPLHQFWAERFLVYPNDPKSGPLRVSPNLGLDNSSSEKGIVDKTEGPKFSSSGLSGAWIPFGGGRHQCPGKHLAKQEVILCIAAMCLLFDIELSSIARLEANKDYYGLGTLPPKGSISFRIRKRIAST